MTANENGNFGEPEYHPLDQEGNEIPSNKPQATEWESPDLTDYAVNEVVVAPQFEEKTGLPEAPSVAWVELFDRFGGKRSVTIRATNPQSALDEVMEIERYAWGRFRLRSAPPKFQAPERTAQQQQPASAPAPTGQAQGHTPPRANQAQTQGKGQAQRTDFEICKIVTMKHIFSPKDGKHRLVMAVDGRQGDIYCSEKVAQKAGISFLDWPIKEAYDPYPELPYIAVAAGSQNAMFFSKDGK
jgi:hypothetical protein